MTFVIKTTSGKYFRRGVCWTAAPNPYELFTTEIHSAKRWISKSAAKEWLRNRCDLRSFAFADYIIEEVA